ncbi:MAG: histidine phosphatase family protein [Oscillospiraceae bacterium]|jgi:probable phosphoglycerate mutase|nr:histidine phosphatase family protein [Oscillospiraceae bacterium]
MKTVITIQHTQSVHHLNGMIGSWTDWELTDVGKERAENIGKRLSAELAGEDFKIYCSDLIRTRQTAEPLLRYLGAAAEYRPELREINLGSACGKSNKWLRENGAIVKAIDDRSLPDAESGRDVWNRLSAFCDEIMATSNDIVVVVAHGFVLPTWWAIWLKWDISMLDKAEFHGAAGGVSSMKETDEGKRVIMRLNDMSYSGEAYGLLELGR